MLRQAPFVRTVPASTFWIRSVCRDFLGYHLYDFSPLKMVRKDLVIMFI